MHDYIVVGGGSAGAVLASRLSEDPATQVLLLEAGENWRSSEADADLRSPNFLRLVLEGRYLWTDLAGTLTEAQDPEPYLVGKGLGGGSTVNAQFWARPPPRDFDAWAEAGCSGWDAETMRPYLNRVEADPDFGGEPYHGDDGPIPVWRAREERGAWGPVDYALSDAASELGHPTAPDRDLAAPGQTGLCDGTYNRADGERVTTNDAYIEPVRDRENLEIRGRTLVDRVIFDGEAASGVAAVTPDGRERFEAERVVLAAGAIFTPTILVRSGIGPRDQLESLDVPVRSERPGLGRLLDHPQLSIVFPLQEDAQLDEIGDPSARTIVFWSSDLEDARENDLHVLSQNFRGVGQEALELGGLLFGLTDAYSTGSVRVTDTDPTAYPEIEVNMLSDDRDLDRVVAAVRHLETLLETPAFQDIVAAEPAIVQEPGKTVPLSDLERDDDLAEALLESIDSYDHPAGTCRMGPTSDPESVVDPEGAVVGVEDLYVADASIMPEIVSVQTNYAVVAAAERIADLLVD